MNYKKYDDQLLTMIASLYYNDNLGQAEVARMAGVSQAKVSRLLTEARKRGIIRISVEPFYPRQEDLEAQLIEKLSLSNAIVVQTISGQNLEQHHRTVAHYAAPEISSLFHPNNVICISAGRQIHQLVEKMKPERSTPGIVVLQTMGQIDANIHDYDAIELGRKCAKKWNGRFYQLQTPAIAPDKKSRDIFIEHEQVKAVLEQMNNAHIALVGIGVLSDSVFIDRGFLKPDDAHRLEQKGVIGEICGRFYNDQGNECETEYRDRVISMSLEQLRKTPKVIAVTSGKNRAKAILGAIKGKLINSLITDNETAAEILIEYEKQTS